jgi:myo-inositol-1(or 4)-monophosphatase
MQTENLADYLEAAQEAAHRAAAILDDWRRRFNVREKGRFDFVTEADVASQQAIRDFLGRRYPHHAFIGEEDKASHVPPGLDAPPTWIVDPLDGTTNYVHDVPFYCVSIGLQIAGEPVVGVVLEPSRRELFRAARGLGAWLGDQRLSASRASRLEEALLATGFPADMRDKDHLLEWWRYFGLHAHGLRRTGSTALNLAYVAAGRFDGYWGFDNHAWDVAAGAVLIQEAGGAITNVDGSSFDPLKPDALAAGKALHPVLQECLRKRL